MDDKLYTITLADGRVIENLKKNGDNFISQNPISKSIFEGNCSPYIVSDGEYEELHEDAELVQVSEMFGEYWFVLRDLSAQEIAMAKMSSDIDFIAMMNDVEL